MKRIHNEEEFQIIYNNVRNAYNFIGQEIPAWNIKQNNVRDKKSDIIYDIDDYRELIKTEEFKNADKIQRDYYTRRWFNHKWALCDEYLFCLNDNCKPNPVYKDKKYDIDISGLLLDVKGTVIPKRELANNGMKYFLDNPGELVKWYYEQQSTGGRYGLQNRLFVVHFSNTGNHDRSRFAFGKKREIYKAFCENIDSIPKYPYIKDGKECFGMILFVCEGETDTKGYIPGLGWCNLKEN